MRCMYSRECWLEVVGLDAVAVDVCSYSVWELDTIYREDLHTRDI